MLAKYYDTGRRADAVGKPKKPPQWEMYDLEEDPEEETNLAHKGHERSELQEKQFQRLKKKLAKVEETRLRERPQ